MIRQRNITAAALALLAALCVASTDAAGRPRTADDVSGQINQTGRNMPMSVPLKDSGRLLGEVLVIVDRDDNITVAKGALLEALQAEGAPETMARLAALPDMVPLEQLRAIGIDINFDRRELSLVMGLTAHQRKEGEISFAGAQRLGSATLSKPAIVSGYLNLFAETAHMWAAGETSLRFDAEAVLHLGGFVLESEFVLQNAVNGQLCPVGALCMFDPSGGIKRRGSRLVYDMPEWKNRITVGDVATNTTVFQRGPAVGGITIEHAPTKLDPTRAIRSTGSQTFVIERPSTVDVILNGAAVQRLNLPPGSYNLRDLPLRAGANEITLVVSDDAGASRTLHFNMFSGNSLLAAGKAEWSATAGVPSHVRDNEITYLDGRYMASVFARYGVATGLTVEAQAQADNRVVMGGGGVVAASPFGIWGLSAAASQTDNGLFGQAVRLTWDIARGNGVESLRLSGEWRHQDFRVPGQIDIVPNEIIYPIYEHRMSFAASYSRHLAGLAQNLRGSISARYDIANETFTSNYPLIARGDRYHLNLTLSHPLFEDATISGTIGYSNEIYSRSFTDLASTRLDDTSGALWAGLRVFWRPTDRTVITSSDDTLHQRGLMIATHRSAPGVETWSTSLSVADDRSVGVSSVGGDANLRTQRYEVTTGHHASLPTGTPDGFATEQRTRVRVGTSLVFADGAVAVSAPVRGEGGFAILKSHESLGDRVVTAGTDAYPKARSDWLGAPVATGFSPYVAQNLPVDVADLPTGYSLGAAGFDLKPGYKAGYRLVVGSGYSVSALGELIDFDGTPLGLVAGIASDGTKQIAVFTNQGGKFAADGLAPGPWSLTMEGDNGKVIYRFVVPEGEKGLVRLGTLRPERR